MSITVVFRSIRTSHVPRHPNLYEMSHVSRVPSFLFETIPQAIFLCSKCRFLERLLHQHFWHGFLPITFIIWRDTNVITYSSYIVTKAEKDQSQEFIYLRHMKYCRGLAFKLSKINATFLWYIPNIPCHFKSRYC